MTKIEQFWSHFSHRPYTRNFDFFSFFFGTPLCSLPKYEENFLYVLYKIGIVARNDVSRMRLATFGDVISNLTDKKR